MPPVALTIAGSDPSGGAGIQADLKTFQRFGVYGTSAIALITVQNTMRVDRVECLSAELVVQQIGALIEDIPPAAAKTGALGNREIVEAVAALAAAFQFPLVVDPVFLSKRGAPLLDPTALRERLLPRAFLLTPNLDEASALTGFPVTDVPSMRTAAEMLVRMGARSVLVKGGHLTGAAIDILVHEGKFHEFEMPRIETQHTHGTGCAYSAAITALLARGLALPEAVAAAKEYIHRAIATNPGLGHGAGPVNH